MGDSSRLRNSWQPTGPSLEVIWNQDGFDNPQDPPMPAQDHGMMRIRVATAAFQAPRQVPLQRQSNHYIRPRRSVDGYPDRKPCLPLVRRWCEPLIPANRMATASRRIRLFAKTENWSATSTGVLSRHPRTTSHWPLIMRAKIPAD
jgi:hypothetical protein